MVQLPSEGQIIGFIAFVFLLGFGLASLVAWIIP
jgi:hypothetical protein